MKLLKYLIYVLIAAFFLIQFIPANLPENNNDLSRDLVVAERAPDKVKQILSKACYDCHSNQTNYPWYSYVAPISWLVSRDTRIGREELNLSDWSDLSKRKKIKVLNEMAEEMEERNMPLKIYTVIHRDAILSEDEIKTITDWTESVSAGILGD